MTDKPKNNVTFQKYQDEHGNPYVIVKVDNIDWLGFYVVGDKSQSEHTALRVQTLQNVHPYTLAEFEVPYVALEDPAIIPLEAWGKEQ